MPTITLFERQKYPYADLEWGPQHPIIEQLALLNESSEVELLRLGHSYLQATQFVGVIRVGETTLQILPKIDYDPAGDTEATLGSRPHQAAVHTATRNLLYLLSYTQNLQIREQDIAPLLARRSDWFELLTRLLAMNLHRLMKRGLEHSYLMVEETIPVMRGRWQVERQITRRPHLRHVFDVVYDEFSPDTALNRVFRFVVEHLLPITRDNGNRRLLRDIYKWLAGVQRLGSIAPASLDQIHFTRLNERFRPVFNLARLFIENSTFQLSSGQYHTFAFVFNMDRLFEEFVYEFMLRHRRWLLPDVWLDVRIKAQSQGKAIYLAQQMPARHHVFRLYPDILFTSVSGKPVLIIDTKYKRLKRDSRRLGVSEDDMYQMLAYSTRLDCSRTLLLYPQWAGSPTAPVQFETLGHPSQLVVATLNLCQPLDCPRPLIEKLSEILKEVSYDGPVP